MFDNLSTIRQFRSGIEKGKKISKKKKCCKNMYYLGQVIFSISSLALFLGGIIMTAYLFSRHTSQNIDYWKETNSDYLFLPYVIVLICIIIYLLNLIIAIRTEKTTPRDSNKPLFFFWHVIWTNLLYFLGDLVMPEWNGFVILWYFPSFLISLFIWAFIWKKCQKKKNRRTVEKITQTIQVKPPVARKYQVMVGGTTMFPIAGTLEEIPL